MPPLQTAPADTTPSTGGADASAQTTPQAGQNTPAFSPLYQQIKQLILQSLENGEWKPGDTIPSELELAARYRVSQGTVRKAIDELAADNLLVRRQGKGTFVATHAEQQVQYRFLRLQPDNGERPTPGERQVIDVRRMRAPADVARALGLRASEPVLQVRRVLSFDAKPTILEEVWLPGGPFKGLTQEVLSAHQGAMYALFETRYGVRMVRAEEKIKAVAADAATANHLDTATGTPLLYVERLAYTYNDIPMEWRRGWYRTTTHHYANTLN